MRRLGRRAFLGGAAALAASPAWAQAAPKKIVLHGAQLLRPGLAPLDGAVIEIADGKIVSANQGTASGDIDVTGKTITAGLTDLMTQTGLVEISLEESSRHTSDARKDDPIRAAFRAADGYNPASTVVAVTRLGGVSSVGVVPSGGLVSGLSAWADLDGATPSAALASRQVALHVRFEHREGELAAAGTVALRLRELFDDAREFARNPGGFDRRQMRRLAASRLDLAAVGQALRGTVPVVFHVDRAATMLAALGLAKEFGLRPVLASAAEGWKVASEIVAAKAPVIVMPLDHGPRNFDARYAREDNAALLAKAGVTVALSTFETHNARKLRQVAGNAVRAGLDKQAALAAVTETPATIAGLGNRYGSVAAGRVANLVVWSGDPFELSTRVEKLFIRGREVSLRSRQTALFERYRRKSR